MSLQSNQATPHFNAAANERAKKRYTRTQFFGVATAALLATAASFGFAGAASATTSAPMPLKATFSDTVAFTSPSSIALHGVGHSTLMGNSTNDGLAVISGSTTAAGCIPNTHTETLTAANGDQLVIESDDLACPTGPTSLHGTGHWYVVSGTGRFSGDTGEGSFDGHADFGPAFSPGTSTFTLTGAITQP